MGQPDFDNCERIEDIVLKGALVALVERLKAEGCTFTTYSYMDDTGIYSIKVWEAINGQAGFSEDDVSDGGFAGDSDAESG